MILKITRDSQTYNTVYDETLETLIENMNDEGFHWLVNERKKALMSFYPTYTEWLQFNQYPNTEDYFNYYVYIASRKVSGEENTIAIMYN